MSGETPEFYVGQVLTEHADIDRLPVGSIIVWGDPGDEEVAVVNQWEDDGERQLNNTAIYYASQSYVVTLPCTIVRLGEVTQ
jgi:hypothetical protein